MLLVKAELLNTSSSSNTKNIKNVISMAGEVPTGVKIISVLYYIGAAFELIFGIVLFFGAGALKTKVPFLAFLGPFLIIGAVILIGLAVLSFFVGRGLWKAQKWSRIVALVFAVIGVLLTVLGMVQGQIAGNVVGLAISAAIGGYLWFSNDVKAAFA